ncbi:MAG TPA: hypothetical protein P5309_01310 [Syntrophomonadaceae bacterium]|nr:hypothetical protein [Syntrophomonadaceae bacterium]
MLQAQSSAARDWNYNQKLAESPRTVKARRTVLKVNHKRKLYLKASFAVFAYALLLVALCMKSASLGYEIERLEQEIQAMTTANQRLEYQIAEKSSLAHVEQVAVNQLGMYKADAKTSIAMAAQAKPVSVAANTYADVDNMSLSQRLLNNLYASLSRLAANN